MKRKIRIKSPEHSIAVQNRLFELGYCWGDGTNRPKYTEQDFLFIPLKTRWPLSYSGLKHGLEENLHKLITLDELYDLTFVVANNKTESEELINWCIENNKGNPYKKEPEKYPFCVAPFGKLAGWSDQMDRATNYISHEDFFSFQDALKTA